MKKDFIEPGIIQTFRLFLIVQGVILLLGFLVFIIESNPILPYFNILFFIHTVCISILIFWNGLQKFLEKYYLPLILIFTAIGPGVCYALSTAMRMASGLRGDSAINEPGTLILWLLVPLLLISSQYGVWIMFSFTLGTAILDIILAGILDLSGGPDIMLILNEVMIRIFLFFLIGYVVVRLTSAQRKQRLELTEKNLQLSNYAATLEQLSISRERNRLARELHDTLAHTLTALTVQLQAAEVLLKDNPPEAENIIQQAQEMTRSGSREARRALNALRASPLEDMGLLLALKQLSESAAVRTGLTLNLDLPEQIPSLKPETEQQIYRIAEETINNVIRHANASELTLSLKNNASKIILCVNDNGCGFTTDEHTKKDNYGLKGIKERAAIINGNISIKSAPEKGTKIELTVRE